MITKAIKIKRLTLENFKCHKNLTLDFAGGNASVYGDNATGKTSIYDALTWLLFGKDSHGNGEKNIEIKPLTHGGEVRDHLAVTAVEAVLQVDEENQGCEVTLRRTYREVWTTKRGNSEATYDGNTSEYYIDGVPVKKFAFADKVNEIVDEDTFRMLTSVSHFADGISWQDRRAVLFRVAGVLSDHEILATDERFIPLIEGMGKLSIDDYKKKLLADKKGFTGAKTEIPARISECQKTIEDVEGLDFAGARAEIESLNAKRENVEKQIIALEHDMLADEKRMAIREAKLELDKLETENNNYRLRQTANAPDTTGMRNNLARLQTQHSMKFKTIANEKAYVEGLDGEIASARERWIAVNGESFAGGNCPTCGQMLPAAQLKAATDNFEAQKAKRLREIEQTANARKEAKAAAIARLDSISSEIAALESEITKTSGILTAAESNVVAVVDMAGYSERKAAAEGKIHALESELAEMAQSTANVKNELQKQIYAIKAEADKHREIISRESLLEYSRKRVEELREDARNAAACLEAIENVLFLIEEYSRYKTRFIEDSINGLFRIARFRLFREQANGGLEDRCDVVYEGVPYIGLNSGAKINVGIDIINTLSRAFGVSVPLFVDNAESVTRLEAADCQIIRLVVSEIDKELRINYEN